MRLVEKLSNRIVETKMIEVHLNHCDKQFLLTLSGKKLLCALGLSSQRDEKKMEGTVNDCNKNVLLTLTAKNLLCALGVTTTDDQRHRFQGEREKDCEKHFQNILIRLSGKDLLRVLGLSHDVQKRSFHDDKHRNRKRRDDICQQMKTNDDDVVRQAREKQANRLRCENEQKRELIGEMMRIRSDFNVPRSCRMKNFHWINKFDSN